MILKNLNYPLNFKFKLTTLASDFNITDKDGNYVAYVRQKMFKLKEDVVIFSDQKKTTELFRIKADRWMDFNACYDIMGLPDNKKYGRLVRKGVKSLWKATYQIVDENDQKKFIITKDNG